MKINLSLQNNKDAIIKDYSILTMQGLADKYGVSLGAIHHLLKKNSIRNTKNYRKYAVNVDFFKEIDSGKKAYVLGFFYADGWVSKDLKSCGMNLGEKDEDILIRMSNEFFVNRKELLHIPKKNKNWSDQKLLIVCCKEFVKNLVNLGCYPTKSLTLKFPNKEILPEKYFSHFLRGYFDGDGSIYINKRNTICLSIVGSLDMAFGISDILNDLGIKFYTEKINIHGTSVIRIGGSLGSLKLLNYIYNDAKEWKLERKWLMFLKSIETLSKSAHLYNTTREQIKISKSILETKQQIEL